MLTLFLSLALAAPSDVIETDAGPLTVHPVSHGSFYFEWNNRVFWVDPAGRSGVTTDSGPKAHAVFVTDIHADHMDAVLIDGLLAKKGDVVAPAAVAAELGDRVTVVLKNGESAEVQGLSVQALPMYNNHRGPKPGVLFHAPGRGNGYLITAGGKRVYIAGDTACTKEMRALEDIDVAFVPMNLPYTMPPEEAAACIAFFAPVVLYPYHYRNSDPSTLDKALADLPIEVRHREWYPATD